MLSDTSVLLSEMTKRLLADQLDDAVIRAAQSGIWPAGPWKAAVEQGLPLALVEGEQGFGVPIDAGLALIRLLGRHAAPLPMAETMIANALLARAGLPVTDGVLAMVPEGDGIVLESRNAAWYAMGEAERVAWGRQATALVVESDGKIALVTSGFRVIGKGTNLAGMPRDRMAIDGAAQIAPLTGLSILEAGALVRALAMAGALETLVAMTKTYVTERMQFGRALSNFQAVQHALARLASEAAAASAAADLAGDAFASRPRQASLAIAAARSRIAEAAGIAIGLAHQLHGAIGFTKEHRLQLFTTALWSWRDEFGAASWWTRRLGRAALGSSKADYWPLITSV